MPSRFSCDGHNVSPPLAWDGLPSGTQSLAIICTSRTSVGSTWVHWLVYDMPSSATGLPEAAPSMNGLPQGSANGKNGWGRNDYGGPCPAAGERRCHFCLYALDTTLDLPEGASRSKVLRAMRGHVLAEAELVGRYSR